VVEHGYLITYDDPHAGRARHRAIGPAGTSIALRDTPPRRFWKCLALTSVALDRLVVEEHDRHHFVERQWNEPRVGPLDSGGPGGGLVVDYPGWPLRFGRVVRGATRGTA